MCAVTLWVVSARVGGSRFTVASVLLPGGQDCGPRARAWRFRHDTEGSRAIQSCVIVAQLVPTQRYLACFGACACGGPQAHPGSVVTRQRRSSMSTPDHWSFTITRVLTYAVSEVQV